MSIESIEKLAELVAEKIQAKRETDLYYTPAEAAEYMRKTLPAFRQWTYINRKDADAQLGRRRLYKRSTLDRWMQEGTPSAVDKRLRLRSA